MEHPQVAADSSRSGVPAPGSARTGASSRLVPVLRTVGAGETREAGILQEIACSPAAIVLQVKLLDGVRRIGAPKFEQIAFISYRDDLAGGVACGPRREPEAVYVTWRPEGPPGTDGRAVAVEFLPDGFTPER
jgi:hypothetical protein